MKKYNLIVIGGGFSGVTAAVSAARNGLDVLLVEKNGVLGGAMTNNLVYPFAGYWTRIPETNEKKQLNSGIFEDIRKLQLKYCGNDKNSFFNPEYYKFILDELVTDANVDILFHSTLFDIQKDGKFIKSVSLATPSGVLTVESDFFCDASGNGDLFAFAGCDYQLGRESDSLCQPMTTCFRLCNVDTELFKKESDMVNQKYSELQQAGEITNPRENILVFYGIGDGIIHLNTTRVVKHNPVDVFDLSKAEITARRQVYEMDSFLKKHSKAFKNSEIVSVSNEIGVRESRKLKGCYILTDRDLIDMVDFEDTIALGNYSIDIHNPEGGGTIMHDFKAGEYYKIPYRSLLPKEYENLVVAGRCISATHEAQSAIRVIPICASLGEAAGTAVAVAHATGKTAHTLDVKLLREKLLANGAAI